MPQTYLFFVGSYTHKLGHVDGCGPGVVACQLDSDTGKLSIAGEAVALPNPSFLWLNQEGNRLYASCEICEYEGREDGVVAVLSAGKKGELSLLGKSSSAGMGPAYCRGDESGQVLLVANYVGGTVACLPLAGDGTFVGEISSSQHFGTGPNEERQEAPHPHSIMALPGNEYVLAADLGVDTLVAYELDAENGCILNDDTRSVAIPAGKGPRHMVVHPKLRVLYVALELTSEIACVRFDKEWRRIGEVKIVQSHGLPADSDSHPSEILISNDGRHLYIANRILNMISGFEVGDFGELNHIGDFDCGGDTPRHMALSPDDRVLVVANQDSSVLVSLFRNLESGALSSAGEGLEIGTPCFVEFSK